MANEDIKEVKEENTENTSNDARTVGDAFLDQMYARFSSKNEKTSSRLYQVSDDLDDLSELGNYKFLKESNTAFEISFDMKDINNNFINMSGEVAVVLREPAHSPTFLKNSDYIVGRSLKVVVDEIDEKNNIVYVTNVARMDATQSRVIASLDAKIDAGIKRKVSGTIVQVKDEYVIVDIFNQGVMGICNKANWDVQYVSNIRDVAVVGDVCDFYVVGRQDSKQTRKGRTLPPRYILTHKGIEDTPWERLKNNEMYKHTLSERSILLVKCIDVPKGKTYWWGKVDSIKGIDIMCNFTMSVSRPEVGRVYRCVVSEFDPDKHILRCSPFSPSAAASVNTAADTVKKHKQAFEALKKAKKEAAATAADTEQPTAMKTEEETTASVVETPVVIEAPKI